MECWSVGVMDRGFCREAAYAAACSRSASSRRPGKARSIRRMQRRRKDEAPGLGQSSWRAAGSQ
jgi:hypothetical protein